VSVDTKEMRKWADSPIGTGTLRQRLRSAADEMDELRAGLRNAVTALTDISKGLHMVESRPLALKALEELQQLLGPPP
jgi:hypothetical protein